MHAGAGPPHLEFACDGCFVHLLNELDASRDVFALDASSGRLAPVGHWATQAQPRGFAIDSPGRFVLVAGERSNRVGVHAIDPGNGALEAVQETEAGRGPNRAETVELG